MSHMITYVLLFVFSIGIIALCYGFYFLYRYLRVANAYVAKTLCSAVFVSGQDLRSVIEEQSKGYPQIRYLRIKNDAEEKTTRVSLLGLVERQAIYRPGLGATLVTTGSEAELQRQVPKGWRPPAPDRQHQAWPSGDANRMVPASLGVESRQLQRILDEAFSEPNPELFWRGTHALIILFRGQIIAERYGPGIRREMPLLGWSMTKTVINALTGILVAEGKLDLFAPAPVPEWQQPDDPRRHITLDQLLRMSSGLAFSEDYGNLLSDVSQMLFVNGDTAAFAARKALAMAPDSKWHYASGTTSIIARILRTAIGGNLDDYFAFPYEKLFHRIGMRSVVLEPDAAGTFVGSSYMYASARDWARFGLLLLNDGVWQGERILPKDWLRYSTTPTLGADEGQYGAHVWLNRGAHGNPSRRWLPTLPADLYAARGHDGQCLVVIPSRDLVVLRLGFTPKGIGWNLEKFLTGVLQILPQPASVPELEKIAEFLPERHRVAV